MKKLITVILPLLILGCSTSEYVELPQNSETQQRIDTELDKSKERKTNYLEVVDHSMLFEPGNEFQINSFYKDEDISFSFTDKATVQMIIEEMNALLLYQGNYINNCLTEDSESGGSNDSSNAITDALGSLPLAGGAAMPQESTQLSEDYKKFIYDGKLSGLFKSLENIYDVSVKFYDDQYVVSRCSMENIPLAGLLSSMEASLETASNSAGGSGSFSGSMDLSYDLKASLMEEVEMLLSEEGTVRANNTTGSLLVVERPSYLRQVKRLVDDYNQVLEQQILLLVTVLRYGDNDVNKLGLDWDSIITSGSTSIIPSSSFSDNIAGLDLGFKKDGSSTTDLILRSYFNNTHSLLSTKADLLTQNGVPTPLSIAKEQSYISTVTTEYDKDLDREIREVGTDVINEGFNMMFKALAVNDKISVTTHITQNELVGLTEDQGITLPTVFNRQFLQSFRVNSGDVILLAGYEENSARTSDSSAAPGTIIFGGSNNRDLDRSKIVILIEPRVI
ncbi:hypothetical protein KI655_05290 [Vibrio sp. D404a]|uniref:hypothetical protein n=1 Tax=unclassified Vibrio TaxID=2614977 RepID=UPI002553C276|nr:MULTISPECIES: hypothetical protein [unclassified Vibrio]MDK9736709.1 hypothetical protein [Vibrio sp. D404a]MDK9797018.1 hypothetical protein [Vibrio sp. D449a]